MKLNRWSWLVALCFWALSPSASAQLRLKLSLLETPSAVSRARASGIAGRERATLRLGDPVPIRIELLNEGDAPVQISASLNPAAGFTTLMLIAPGGRREQIMAPTWQTKDVLAKQRSLKPGESLAYETTLFGNQLRDRSLKYLFDTNGTHQLVVSYGGGPKEVISNPVNIEVGLPISGWEEFKAAGIVDHLEGQSRSNKEHQERGKALESLSKKYPQQPFAPWLAPDTR